jgi:hypothetical protein
LELDSGSRLITDDFYTAPDASPHAHTVRVTGASAEIVAYENVNLNKDFTSTSPNRLKDLSLVMKGTGSVYADAKQLAANGNVIGNLTIGPPDPGDTTRAAIASDIIIRGDLTIANLSGDDSFLYGGTASVLPPFPSPHIHIEGDSSSTPAAKWEQYIEGSYPPFDPRQSIVEFGAYTGSGREFHIEGNTAFYELACLEPLAKIKFSNYDATNKDTHKVTHKFTAFPSNAPYPGNNIGSASNMLTLSRLDTPAPPYALVPYTDALDQYIPPTDPNNGFWHFDLAPGSELELNWTIIYYSFSTKRLPAPANDSGGSWRVDAFPYQLVLTTNPTTVNENLGTPANPGEGSYYNVNWYAPNQFYYAFSEDTDGNGRIDRLRLQSPFEVIMDWPLGSTKVPSGTPPFEGFEVAVDGYEIDKARGYRGYARADWDESTNTNTGDADKLDSIFVYLVEKNYTDGGDRLRWTLVSNKYLYDLTTRSILVGEPGDKDSSGLSWDTVSPRINYALTLPNTDKHEIYFQMSEPVDMAAINVSAVDPGLVVSPGFSQAQPLDSSVSGASQFIIPLTESYPITDLAAVTPPSFTLTNNVSTPIVDLADDALDRHYDYNIDPYAYQYPSPKYPVDYNYSHYEFVRQNNRAGTGAIKIPNVLNSTSDISHRVTDVLVSVPPVSAADERYFVWPIWAKYNDKDSSAALSGEFGLSKLEDTGIIWQFNGKKYLEAEDIDLQVKRNSLLGGAPVIRYGLNVPGNYRGQAISGGYGNGNPGLWLPEDLSPPPPPLPPPPFVNLSPRFFSSFPKSHDGSLSWGENYTYRFNKNIDGYNSPTMLDFFFHLGGTTPSDLFVARLDINSGVSIPSNWYQLVRPFSFEIHDITRQRSGVTILNNVINPNNGESTYVHYQLIKGGPVTIQVFTMDGTMVDSLYRGHRDAGEYRAVWGGKNRGGRAVARGMYFIRVVGPDIDEIRKVMVVK